MAMTGHIGCSVIERAVNINGNAPVAASGAKKLILKNLCTGRVVFCRKLC